MSFFRPHTATTAPEASREYIERAVAAFSFLPNLHAVLAEAPAALKGYIDLFETFESETGLTPEERQVVFLVSSFENRCHYCVPGHSFIMEANQMPAEVIEALRNGNPLSQPRLQALQLYAKRLLDGRGHLSDGELREFFDAGFTQREALEVLVGMAAKLNSNFANALARTELDEPIKPYASSQHG